MLCLFCFWNDGLAAGAGDDRVRRPAGVVVENPRTGPDPPQATRRAPARRLRALERRITAVQTSDISIGQVVLDTLTHTVSVSGKNLELPRREFMLLKALMENPGRVMSREKLETRLYGWGEELASNSIEVHIHHLRKKIPAGFIKTIRGIGYTVPRM